jgi:hypothetical protein
VVPHDVDEVPRSSQYHQSYSLRRFRDLLTVKAWVDGFVDWYNAEHLQSGIKSVTPNQHHYGQADAICAIRQQIYEEARRGVLSVGAANPVTGHRPRF